MERWGSREFDEHYVLSAVGDTLRTYRDYAPICGFVNAESLLRTINGKGVIDVGSGFDGFAISAAIARSRARILSVNPRRALPGFNDERLVTLAGFQHSLGMPLEQIILEILPKVDRLSSASYAHDMSDIETECAEFLFDVIAVNFYANLSGDSIYAYGTAMGEYARVLMPGGHAYIVDSSAYFGCNRDSFKQTILEGAGFQLEEVIGYRQLSSPHYPTQNLRIHKV